MRYEIINEKKRLMGITNAQLSEMTGVTLSTLDKITSGANQNPKLGTLKAIAKAINCTLDDFDDIAVNSLSSAALTLARKYDALDDHGKMVLDAIADLETQRLAVPDRSSPEAHAEARKMVEEALASTAVRQAQEA